MNRTTQLATEFAAKAAQQDKLETELTGMEAWAVFLHHSIDTQRSTSVSTLHIAIQCQAFFSQHIGCVGRQRLRLRRRHGRAGQPGSDRREADAGATRLQRGVANVGQQAQERRLRVTSCPKQGSPFFVSARFGLGATEPAGLTYKRMFKDVKNRTTAGSDTPPN